MRSLLGRPGVHYTVKTVSPGEKLAEIKKRLSNVACKVVVDCWSFKSVGS